MLLQEFKDNILGYFGWPLVKVEIHEAHLNSVIERAFNFHKKWGTGISTNEIFFTKLVSSGIDEYDLPVGVQTVVKVWDFSSTIGKADELFTISNQMYQNNFLGDISGFNLIDLEIGMQFVSLLEKYNVSKYRWNYHEYNNKLNVYPFPDEDRYILVRSFIEEGYRFNNENLDPGWREFLYEDPWFFDYSIALVKIILGNIRRKFTNFSSLGNAAISLDGDSMSQEGLEEKQTLEEKLKIENYEGLDISYG